MDNIARVLRLTEKMLQASRSGEWDLLATLQQQREQLLHDTASQTGSAMEPNLTLSTLHKVLSINEEITSIARGERRHRQTQLQGLHRSRSAANCYKREARGM